MTLINQVAAPARATTEQTNNQQTYSTKPPLKIEVSLMAFDRRGDTGMNQLEANKEYGDTCLHSMVSELAHDHGINFNRKTEKIMNRAGTTSRFTRYSFATDTDAERARQLINQYRLKRGLFPLEWEV